MLKNFLYNKFVAPAVNEAIKATFAIAETDDTFSIGTAYGQKPRDRNDYDRKLVLEKSLRAWRLNPLARRIVQLTTDYVIGKGFTIEAEKKAKEVFTNFWENDLNDIDGQLEQWSDELYRTGDLFLLYSITENRDVFVRAVPSDQITKIKTTDNDICQERKYIYGTGEDDFYPAKNKTKQESFMRHFAVNHLVGASFGESDLGIVLDWLADHSAWLVNRILLNKFRTAFMYVLRGTFKSPAERTARENELRNNPPKSGSVLVTDGSESWGILSANLDSFDANVDGLAIKKQIAAGAGVPLHWLAEPQSATRTTAVAAGTPTFRRLKARQKVMIRIIKDMLEIVAEYKELKNPAINVHGDDITEKDNSAVALAVARAVPALGDLYDRKLTKKEEFIRLVYSLAGMEPPSEIGEGLRKPLTKSEQLPVLKNPDLEDSENVE